MHICVKMEENSSTLRVHPSLKADFQAFVLLNVSVWSIHVPHVVCDKETRSSYGVLQLFGPLDLFVTDLPF